MELDGWGYFEESHAGLDRAVVGLEGDDVLEGDAVGIEVEVGLIPEAADMDHCSEVEVSV